MYKKDIISIINLFLVDSIFKYEDLDIDTYDPTNKRWSMGLDMNIINSVILLGKEITLDIKIKTCIKEFTDHYKYSFKESLLYESNFIIPLRWLSMSHNSIMEEVLILDILE